MLIEIREIEGDLKSDMINNNKTYLYRIRHNTYSEILLNQVIKFTIVQLWNFIVSARVFYYPIIMILYIF